MGYGLVFGQRTSGCDGRKWTAIGDFLWEYVINDALSPVFLANYGLDINWGGFLG